MLSHRPAYFQFCHERIWLIQFCDFYECVSFEMLVFVCFVRNQEYGKVKIDTNKAVKYLFHWEFCIRIAYWKHQEEPLRGIPFSLKSGNSSQKSANSWKELWWSLFFSKIEGWKCKTLLILNFLQRYSFKDFPRILSYLW